MDRDLAVMVAAAPRAEVDGDFERHVAAKWVARALTGSSAAAAGRHQVPFQSSTSVDPPLQ
jgi:hypothetical protein